MNLLQPNANEATQTQNRSRSTVPTSGLCTRCLAGCRGNCEVFKATFRGREVIYPGPFAMLTAGGFGVTVEEIFVCCEDLVAEFGSNAVKEMPLGAIGLYTFADKLKVGLQQLMAGRRNFSIPAISRKDLMALTPEAAQVSGIPYVMDAYKQEAEEIINS